MESKQIEIIVNEGYTWLIYEIGESVFYKGKTVDTGQSFLFHGLDSLRDFIRQAENSANIKSLFKVYVDQNLATY